MVSEVLGRHLEAIAGESGELDAQVRPFRQGPDDHHWLGLLDPSLPGYRQETEWHAVDLGILRVEHAVLVSVVARSPERTSDDLLTQPGQVDRLWILNVEGARLVIDAFVMPAATTGDRTELQNVVESIVFEREGPELSPSGRRRPPRQASISRGHSLERRPRRRCRAA